MNFSKRVTVLKVTIYGLLTCLILFLFRTQITQSGHFRQVSDHNRVRLIPQMAPRGEITDRHGAIFATSRPAFHVCILPEDFDPKDMPMLSRLLGMPASEIKHRITAARPRSLTPVILRKDVPKELAMKIEERRPSLAGIFIEVEGVRSYPESELSAHVIGYIGKISQAEYETSDQSVYTLRSDVGQMGIERSFDQLLRGEDGGLQVEVNARGEQVSVLSERKPVPGQDVVLSLDARLEREIWPLLTGKSGAIAMMNLKTGEISALLSKPSFDPNLFVSAGKSQERLGLFRDIHRPLVDRAVAGAYPAGSVFKLVTALAGLETRKITANTTFGCKGFFQLTPHSRRFKCWESGGHGNMNLLTALERSCNVYFYNVGRLVGEKELSRYAHVLGLGGPLSLEIPSTDGFIPSAEWKEKRFHHPWYAGETLSFAIGQGYVQVTPVHILNLVSIIANDGRRIAPTLLKHAPESEVPSRKIPIRDTSLKVLRQGMLQVTESRYGTGQLARVDFLKIAAKTGTAQTPPRKAHAWFAGYFPYEDPQVALVVFVEHGGSGGITAAQLAKRVIAKWRELYAPAEEFEKPALPPVSLHGMSL